MRVAAAEPQSWGAALALLTVLLVVHGDATVAAVDVRGEPGTMYGAVWLQASWPFSIPVHLLGIMQLRTWATAGGFGV